MAFTGAGHEQATVECPLDESILNAGFAYEILGGALTLYQLTQQYDLWEQDIDNLQDLADCYEEIGSEYKDKRYELRAKDEEVQNFLSDMPSKEVCDSRIEQARINGLLAVQKEHERALRTIPAWACGEKCNVNYEAAKSEIQLSMHTMAEAENYEYNQVDRYAQLQIAGIARSSGGSIPNLSGAFRTVAAIGEDSLRRSTAGVNSALGAFGNIAGSIGNRFSGNRTQNSQGRVVNNTSTNNTVINNRTITNTVAEDDDFQVGFRNEDAFLDNIGDFNGQ